MLYFDGFFAKLGHFAGFSLHIIDIAGYSPTLQFFAVFFYCSPERSAKLRCEGRGSGDIIFHSLGRRGIIVIVYLEYQSVCPIVGIGSPHPFSESERVSPLGSKGGEEHLFQVRGWGTQFGRLDRRPGTLYTPWPRWYVELKVEKSAA